jgi:hypothetical protein
MKYDEKQNGKKVGDEFCFKKIKQNIKIIDKQHIERGLILTIKCCVLLPKQGSKNPRVGLLLLLHVL